MLPAIAFALVAVISPPSVPPPRIALLYSDYGHFRHRDDYDERIKALGWPMDKYENTQFAELAKRLGDYDIILGSALFNYSHEQDFSRWWPGVEKFLRRGGALVLTDVNYNQHVRWLKKCLGERYAVRIEKCKANGKAALLSPDAEALTSLPYSWRPRAMWAHMRTGPAWRIMARCPDGGVVWAMADFGRGFIWLSSFWPLSREQLINLWDYMRFRRDGFELLSVQGFRELRPGQCRLTAKLRMVDRRYIGEKLFWLVLTPDRRRVLRASEKIRPGADGVAHLNLRLQLRERGLYWTWLAMGGRDGCGGPWSTPVAVNIPPLVNVELLLPRRRAIYLSLPNPALRLLITTHPFGEPLDRAVVKLRVLNNGRVLVRRDLDDFADSPSPHTVTIPLDGLEAGRLVVNMAAENAGRRLWSKSWRLTVVGGHWPQVVIGPHLETYVNGQEFFPIGIYHINPKFYDRAREMGFNCVQVWGTEPEAARANLDRVAAHGLMAVLEMSTLLRGKYQPEKLRAVVRTCRDHPALLAWYPVDEPGPAQLEWCQDAYNIFCREDPNHPVYLVMCAPNRFKQFVPTTDILAIDPYPIPHAPISTVANWMKAARRATAGRQPIWLIPQLHNTAAYRDPSKGRAPTPRELWCMVAQGLVYGAKGIIYYPWDDGPCGLVHEPALMAEIPRINAFLAHYGPEIAACTPKILTGGARTPPGLHAALFSDQRKLLLATNTSDQVVEADLPIPATVTSARSLMTGQPAAVRDGALHVALLPLGVELFELR